MGHDKIFYHVYNQSHKSKQTENKAQELFEEIMARNFPKLIKDWFRKLDEPQTGITRKKSSLQALLIESFKNYMLRAYSEPSTKDMSLNG